MKTKVCNPVFIYVRIKIFAESEGKKISFPTFKTMLNKMYAIKLIRNCKKSHKSRKQCFELK